MKNAGKAYKYRLYRHIRTSKEIIKKSYLIYNKLLPIICVALFPVVVGFGIVIYKWDLVTAVQYLPLVIHGIIAIVGIVVLLCIISILYIMRLGKVENVKGKKSEKPLYLCFVGIKILILAVLVLNTSTFAMDISEFYNLNKSNLEVNQKIKDYIYPTLDASFGRLYNSSEEGNIDARTRLKNFYLDTVEQFDGIILDTGKYYLRGDIDEEDHRRIVINDNYLKVNPIRDQYGNIITEQDFSTEKPNIIISEKENEKEAVSQYVESLNSWEQAYNEETVFQESDINVLYYQEDSKIYGLNPVTNSKYVGVLKQPILLVYDDQFKMFEEIENIISNGGYLLRCTEDNPMEELKPYLQKNNLAEYILEAPYIKNTFSDRISETSNMVIINVALTILYIIPIIVLTIYFVKNYIGSRKRELFIQSINGCGFLEKYFKAVAIEILQLLLIAGVLIYKDIELSVLIWISIVDLVVFYCSVKMLDFENIHAAIKGKQ